MAQADRFNSAVRFLRKKGRELPPERLKEEVRSHFFASMGAYPETLLYDLFNHFLEAYAPEPAEAHDIYAAADQLSRVVDLFDENYETRDDSFTRSDWELIRDAVSDSALEINDKLLTYIMKQVVSRGYFD